MHAFRLREARLRGRLDAELMHTYIGAYLVVLPLSLLHSRLSACPFFLFPGNPLRSYGLYAMFGTRG